MRFDRPGWFFALVSVGAVAAILALVMASPAENDDLVAPLGALAVLNGLLVLQRTISPGLVPTGSNRGGGFGATARDLANSLGQRATSALAAVLLLSVVLMLAWLLFNFLLLAPDPSLS
jgi:hypothetical protein